MQGLKRVMFSLFIVQMKLLGHVGARLGRASHLWTAAAGLTAAGALLFTSEAACEDSKAEVVVAKAGQLSESSLPAAQERPKVCQSWLRPERSANRTVHSWQRPIQWLSLFAAGCTSPKTSGSERERGDAQDKPRPVYSLHTGRTSD